MNINDYKFEVGTPLYLYTARNGKFHIWEGVVFERRGRYYGRLAVRFKNRTQIEMCPNENQIGFIHAGGPRLWLTERDDALARKLFLEYELGKLAALEKMITRKRELIRVLREE